MTDVPEPTDAEVRMLRSRLWAYVPKWTLESLVVFDHRLMRPVFWAVLSCAMMPVRSGAPFEAQRIELATWMIRRAHRLLRDAA
jgi:hypothetical protein